MHTRVCSVPDRADQPIEKLCGGVRRRETAPTRSAGRTSGGDTGIDAALHALRRTTLTGQDCLHGPTATPATPATLPTVARAHRQRRDVHQRVHSSGRSTIAPTSGSLSVALTLPTPWRGAASVPRPLRPGALRWRPPAMAAAVPDVRGARRQGRPVKVTRRLCVVPASAEGGAHHWSRRTVEMRCESQCRRTTKFARQSDLDVVAITVVESTNVRAPDPPASWTVR